MLYYDNDEGRTRRYISGGGQFTENGTWWMTQRFKKVTHAEKDAFMTWQLSRWEQVHKLYQVQIKESKQL